MTGIAQVVLLVWPAVVIACFVFLPTHRAILVSTLSGLMLLPENITFAISGLPDYNKMIAITTVPAVVALLSDGSWIARFRVRWFDAPIIAWCLCPTATVLSNDGGLHTIISYFVAHVMVWALPYALGRLYFYNRETTRELAGGILLAIVLYLPLCWYEMRMAPTLHTQLYGVSPAPFMNHRRWGGYRPMVFMDGGLMLSAWVMYGYVLATGLWMSRSIKAVPASWMGAVWLVVGVSGVLCKSTYIIGLMLVGSAVFAIARLLPLRVVLICFVLTPPTYMTARQVFGISAEPVLAWVEENLGERKMRSLGIRMTSEDVVVERAMSKPWFGHGRGKESFGDEIVGKKMFVETNDGLVRVIPDAYWVIVISAWGIVGLIAFESLFLLPCLMWVTRIPPRHWLTPACGAAFALMTAQTLMAWNFLLNARLNPVIILVAGSVAAFASEFSTRDFEPPRDVRDVRDEAAEPAEPESEAHDVA